MLRRGKRAGKKHAHFYNGVEHVPHTPLIFFVSNIIVSILEYIVVNETSY